MIFPTLTTNDLNGDSRTLPQDFKHSFNLVFIAYLQRQQYDVNSWLPMAERFEKQYASFSYYEFPVAGRMGWLGQKQLNYWMRTGIKDLETRARTMTLYINRDQFCKKLEIETCDDISVLLLDSSGRVIWRTTGWYSLEQESSLRKQIRFAVPA